MPNSDYTKVGAGWKNDNGSISVRLSNEARLTLWPVKDEDRKTDSSPHYRFTMKTSEMDKIGVTA